MKKKYVDWSPSRITQALLIKANQIITTYQARGMKMTLRQLYYRLVASDVIPNKQAEYKRLGNIISQARLAGLVDWDAIEDRGRNLAGLNTYTSPGHFMDTMSSRYWEDLWDDQKNRVEVWVEKEALVGVIGRTATRYRVDYFACKGYTSQTAMWEAAQRLRMYETWGQQPVIIHLGDHDPSGIDMTRDIVDRQGIFDAHQVIVERVALNMDQVRQYDPPPNPAKETDSRFSDYASLYGDECWELDALDPETLDGIISTAILKYLDAGSFEEKKYQESINRDLMVQVANEWDAVVEFIRPPDED